MSTTIDVAPPAGLGSVALPLRGDPLPWLLERRHPAVRHLALRELLDRSSDDPEVVRAQSAAMRSDPIASILAAQHPAGYWQKPGPGYASKYRGTVWQLIFLDQLGADPADERIRRACAYVLDHSLAVSGGFGASGRSDSKAPPPSAVYHCLNGNLLRALIGFGWLEDERVQRAIEWEARAITGEGVERWFASGTSGPGFACAANEHFACGWGAIKAMLGLARIQPTQRSAFVQRAIASGVEFLLSRDPRMADYPMGWGNTRPSGPWFRLGFPSGYVADVLQNVEVLCELGHAHDPRLVYALEWVLAKQDGEGRWRNEYAYNGKTWVDFELQGRPSKWVTLRACRVLRKAGLLDAVVGDSHRENTQALEATTDEQRAAGHPSENLERAIWPFRGRLRESTLGSSDQAPGITSKEREP